MKPFIPQKCVGLLLLAIAGMPLLAAAKNTCTIGASAFASGTLTCVNTSVLLRGNSPVAGVTYSWTGPNGFTSTLQSPMVATPGAYTVVATSPAGCTGTATVTVLQNITPPANVVATTTTGATVLNCRVSLLTLSGSTSTAGTSFVWTGADNFSVNTATATINVPGFYTLTVTNFINGCMANATIAIIENKEYPQVLGLSVEDRLTCAVTSTKITGVCLTPGATFSWTGPDGFSGDSAVERITRGGVYNLTVTHPISGCSMTIPITARQDTTHPVITLTDSGPLTCDIYEDTLSGTSTVPNSIYWWAGPSFDYFYTSQIIAYAPGIYTLMVQGSISRCTTNATLTVVDNCVEEARQMEPAANKTALHEKATAGFIFKTYPNPFAEKAFISFQSPSPDFVSIQVYNNTGLLQKTLFNNRLTPNQSYQLSLNSLPAGMYYVVIRVNNKAYTKQLISIPSNHH